MRSVGFRVLGLRMQDLGFRILGVRMQDLEFRFWGFRIQEFGINDSPSLTPARNPESMIQD